METNRSTAKDDQYGKKYIFQLLSVSHLCCIMFTHSSVFFVLWQCSTNTMVGYDPQSKLIVCATEGIFLAHDAYLVVYSAK